MSDRPTTRPPATTGTLGERRSEGSRRCFVGREGPIELVRSALQTIDPAFAVLYVHGPGGIGKTALLDALERLAETAGMGSVRVDMRTIEPTPATFLDTVRSAFATADADLATTVDATHEPDDLAWLADLGRVVVLIDTFELAVPLHLWLRDRFVPNLASSSLVVVAGRAPPPTDWSTDPGWRDLMRVVTLRNLSPVEARHYLELRGVAAESRTRVVELTHGHPLALSLMVDVMDQRTGSRSSGDPAFEDGFDLADTPDVVRTLVERFVDEIPDGRHREALAVCAHARFTTEDLLRAALDDANPAELFAWLRTRSFVEERRYGVFPHDLAREVLDADLRWRDRTAYRDLHHRVRADIVRRIRESDGRDQQRALADLIYLHRSNPIMRPLYDWARLGHAYADRCHDTDAAAVVAMARSHEGPEQAALVDHWLQRQPEAFTVFRRSGTDVVGFTTILRLDHADADDIAADPGTRCVWNHATSYAPPRPGEALSVTRFFVDRAAHQTSSSPSWTAFSITHARHVLGTPGLGWDFIAAFQTPDVEPVFDYIDYHRVPDADFQVGGRRHLVFAHDWRRVGPDAWVEMMGHRELHDEPGDVMSAGTAHPAPVLVLSHDEFSDAIRQALRNRLRPDLLERSPLIRSRLVRERSTETSPEAGVEALVDALDRAIDTLTDDPRDAKAHRAIDRTFLRPAPSQERAAEVLDMPFSTYRRHLTRGIDRIVEQLWRLELHGDR